MSDAVQGMIIAGVFSLLTLIIPAVINWKKNMASVSREEAETNRVKAEMDKIDMETIWELKKQVIELVRENKEIREEGKEMREENKLLDRRVGQLEKGLQRAIRYINLKLPNETPPDFLLDTGELKAHKK